MIYDLTDIKIYIRPEATDMRKQTNGLSVLVQDELELDPFSGNLFIFCNKNRKRLKILYWHKNGFCLWLKRLEKHKFPWPKAGSQTFDISLKELKLLLDGIDFFSAHKEIICREV